MKQACVSIAFFVLTVSIAYSQLERTNTAPLDSLLNADFGRVYTDDGAGDGTIMETPDPRVKAVVDLRSAVIPILIAHLDDTRPTRTRFQGKPVPLGHVALDILTHVISDTKTVFVQDCADDGLGACINPGYYYRPDAQVAANEKGQKQLVEAV